MADCSGAWSNLVSGLDLPDEGAHRGQNLYPAWQQSMIQRHELVESLCWCEDGLMLPWVRGDPTCKLTELHGMFRLIMEYLSALPRDSGFWVWEKSLSLSHYDLLLLTTMCCLFLCSSSKELADPENLELRSPSSSKAGVGGLLGKVWSSFAADRGGQRGTLAEVENRSGRTLLFFEKNREVWKRNLFRLDPLQTMRLSPECLIDGAETYTRVEVLVLDDRSGKPMTTRPIWIEPFDFVMYKKIIVQGAGTALEILKV
ncbi:hypothetical protein SELMODRAFT_431342 [Selaginella moellendorffii]|uniref:Uncharacterized protein n=1 Tax=Selaginella moellendorffii TaxID=88036 RepID=D8TCA4_SELML|nr:hypothetical protein SELMODRAFT_431342 [Selaginella moellendorffii]